MTTEAGSALMIPSVSAREPGVATAGAGVLASTAADPATAGGLFTSAWCGVGGERGGEVVPRWFGVLPELGVEQAHLFWAVPESADADAALDRLRSASARWIAELRALGMEGDLAIKRGDPGPWLSALAGMSSRSLIVVGPPSRRGSPSVTITYLLEEAASPLLFLPDLFPPEGGLLDRPVVDAGAETETEELLRLVELDGGEPHLLDLDSLPPLEAIRTALRVSEDVDASLLVLPRRASDLVPYALRHGNFPLLVAPASPASHTARD